jgi:hypothetical protein
MRKFFPKRRIGLSKRKRHKRPLKAACLSLTLATAWGYEAAAEVTFKLTIAPEQTLTNAVVFYGNNRTSGALRSLGTIPGGQTSTIFHTLSPGPRGSTPATEPEYYDPALGSASPYFVIIGLHQGEAGHSAIVSFPNDDPVQLMESWEEIFESPAISATYHVTEQALIDDLVDGHPLPQNPDVYVADGARRFSEWYGGIPGVANGRLSTPFGQSATLVHFSDASFGGIAIVDLIPEPATWFLLVSAAGAAFWRPCRSSAY